MNIPYIGEFSLRQVAGRKRELEQKRLKYLAQIAPGSDAKKLIWNWSEGDLDSRLKTEDEFCLLYYKYFMLCRLIMASDEFINWKDKDSPNPPEKLSREDLEREYRQSFGRTPDQNIFKQAAETVHDYISGNVPID